MFSASVCLSNPPLARVEVLGHEIWDVTVGFALSRHLAHSVLRLVCKVEQRE